MAGAREKPQFIGSEICRSSTYGSGHPLAIPRVSTCIDLCRALGWLPSEVYHDSPKATPAVLERFHQPAYVAALMEAEARQSAPAEMRQRHNFGRNGNPIFPEIFSRPATAAGGTLLAVKLILESGHDQPIVYNPAGGTHHGQPDRASGFCYLNDPALGLLALLDGGLRRVLYLDVDAHHADGVQAAFAEDPRVLTISLHEANRWPMQADCKTGEVTDRAGGGARNLPVPPGFNDQELDYLLEAAILPLATDFEPEAVMLQCGADGLADDPMSKLELSNGALWRVVAAMRALGLPLIVLGGGGYNPWSVARCWAGVWATLNGKALPERLSGPAEAVLRGLTWRHRQGRHPPEHWYTTLLDPSRMGPVRPEVRSLAAEVLAP